MVGRLVEQQDVGIGGEDAGERRAARFAARELRRIGAADRRRDRPSAPARDKDCPPRRGRSARNRASSRSPSGRAPAADSAGARWAARSAFPPSALASPGGDLQQRRLARAVAPDQRDPVARRNRQFRALEQRRAAERQADVSQLQLRRHMKQTRLGGAGRTHRAPRRKRERSMTQTAPARDLLRARRTSRRRARPHDRRRIRRRSASVSSAFTSSSTISSTITPSSGSTPRRLRSWSRLAEAAEVAAKRDAMFRGELVNSTERRAALHTALAQLLRRAGPRRRPRRHARRRGRARQDARLRRRRARGPPARRARPADDRRRQYRHRRLRPRPGDGGAGACRPTRRRTCAPISSPTSTAPTSPTRCAASIPRAPCSSSPRRPSPRRRR